MKKLLSSLASLLLTFGLCVVLPAEKSFAASDYDAVVQPLAEIKIDNASTSGCRLVNEDHTYSWSRFITSGSSDIAYYLNGNTADYSNATIQGMVSDFESAGLTSAGFRSVVMSNSNQDLIVSFNPSARPQAGFVTYSGYGKGLQYSTTPGEKQVIVRVLSTCKYGVFFWNQGLGWHQTLAVLQDGQIESSRRPFIYNGDVAPYAGYEGVQVPTSPPLAKYVAMGDSFSSGEGNEPFEIGTDTATDQCHRSTVAYPRLLQANAGLGSTAFVACSGATTNDILGVPETDNPVGTWGEDAQISAVSQTTEVVTITIGGNDVGFKQFATECLFPMDTYIGHEGSCDEFTSIYDETIDKINLELPNKLEQVYSTLLTDAPNATIYVIGYPQLAPYKSISDSFDQDCGGLYDAWPNNWGDARAANEVVDLLNGKIEATVTAVNQVNSSSRLVYVPVENGGFSGHDACSDVSYFHGIHWPNDIEYSVHPNTDGHIAYSQDVLNAMN